MIVSIQPSDKVQYIIIAISFPHLPTFFTYCMCVCTPMTIMWLYDHSLLIVSFVPTDYTVTEGVDLFANIMLVRSRNTSKTAAVIVCTQSRTAIGMSEYEYT